MYMVIHCHSWPILANPCGAMDADGACEGRQLDIGGCLAQRLPEKV